MRRRLLLMVVGALALGSCGTGDERVDTAAAAATRIPGLTAVLQQYRTDEIQGLISVQTTNASSSTVRFRDLRLEWPGLAPTEPNVRVTELAPGVRLDVRVVEGDAVCGDPPTGDSAAPDAPVVAVGHASVDGATPVLVAVPVDDDAAILAKVFRRSCVEQHQRWAAELTFGREWTESTTGDGAAAVLGSIELRRRSSDQPLTVTQVNGSVLLRIRETEPADPVLTLDPGDDTATIPIVIEQSGNCSAHALAESKKTFIIPIGFAIGDDDPSSYVIEFDDPTKRLLNAMINEHCGVG